MKLKDIEARVAEIQALHRDPEAAHGREDQLYLDLITAIAKGELYGIAAVKAAKAVLQTQEIKFPRWSA